ncbi:translocation/assembly module TamB domain-containing protein [Bacteroides sp.]
MKRKWIKRVCWVLFTPILLFIILMVLLYIPPVQNFLRREAAEYASKATGMQISVRRIDLRFPLNLLVRGVEVVQTPDTLLSLESLNVHVQALPLFRGKVEVEDILLQQVSVNSANLIEGMRIKGVLGRFNLQSHGVDLTNEVAIVNHAELFDTHVELVMNDTTATPQDTTSTALQWRVALQNLKLKNVSFSMQLPADSMRLATHVGEATVKGAEADLKNLRYGLRSFLLTGTSLNYDTGSAAPSEGFDASHIALRDINIGIDSVLWHGRNMNAVIREFSMNERSGLSVTSLTGRLFANDTIIKVPRLQLLTPHSEMNLEAHTYWELVNMPTTGRLAARFSAMIGKQDVMLFAGGLPESFKKAYPFRPLVVRAGTEGNLKEMQITRFMAELPGAFSITGGGELLNLSDSLQRSGTVGLQMITKNLNFLAGLTGQAPDGTLVIPNNMTLVGKLGFKGPQYDALLRLKEGEGALNLKARYNTTTEAYLADLNIDKLQLHNFLPKDSIYELTLSADASGRGVDFTSRRTAASLTASLDALRYGRYHISGIDVKGNVKNGLATANVTSDNTLLKMTADAEYDLTKRYVDGKAEVDVQFLDLYRLGLVPHPLKRTLAFNLTGEVRRERIFTHFTAGDMKMNLSARSGLDPFIRQSVNFVDVLMKQVELKEINHSNLRKALPTAIFSFSAGKENPLAYYLETKNIAFHDIAVKFGTAPDWGINGKASIHALKMDTLQLDTIFFAVKQDTARMNLHGAVINGPRNPQIVFKAGITGEIRNQDADLTLKYENDKGETGVLLGVNVRPLLGGAGKGDGLAFTLIPANPIIAFRKFHFVDDHNWIYLHKNMRVYANVDLRDNSDMGFRMQSNRRDTTSLQNIDVELQRIRLAEISKVLPYLPELSGLFSAEANYVQTATSLQVSAEATIDELTYEQRRVGDITLGATWLPGDKGEHYISTYLTHDDTEILIADGSLHPTETADEDNIKVNATMEHFPLKIADAFIPDQVVSLSGDMDGELHITGNTSKPQVNGELVLDSVSVYARQAGARFTFDNRPVQIKDNLLLFDKFAIFTTSKNPFTIDGSVDFRELSRPTANLKMFAENYTLLNAPRTKESLVYGKVLVDFDATLKGPLDGLTMRGTMNLLNKTDVTYVLTDSPLTVQDRLSDLVTFTSFSDTTTVQKQVVPTVSLGGLDMLMQVQIDPGVRLKADLSADRSNRVELQGGGNLTLRYPPQGDLTLIGRYTLTGGMIKYNLPVIPNLEFNVDNGSYVEWTGNPADPTLNLQATERRRASVGGEGGQSRMVNFDITISIKNRLENLELGFGISAPDDTEVQNQLASMSVEERNKQAIAMLATGVYLADSGSSGSGGLNMGSALNSILASQINALAGNLKNASISVGVENHDMADAGGTRTDYSFRYSQRFFNDRFQIVVGGKVSTGAQATNDVESFIDNISLEYRLDASGTRYVRLFHNKNYESVLEGEITETGIGLVLRKRIDKLSELFIFRRKKKEEASPTVGGK